MKKLRYVFLIVCFGMMVTSCSSQQKLNAFKYTTNKSIDCKNGAVVSANTLASQVGVSILKQGGNAVDAAIATQLALAVVYPGAGIYHRTGIFRPAFPERLRACLNA